MIKKTYFIPTLISLIISIVIAVNVYIGRSSQADLQVYYGASLDLSGIQISNPMFDNKPVSDKSVYGKSYGVGSGQYKYPPSTFAFIYPFKYIKWEYFYLIYIILNSFLAVFTLFHFVSFINLRYFSNLSLKSNIVLLSILIIGNQHIFRELRLGNINFLLIFLGLLILRSKNLLIRSFLLAVLINLKPYFIILLLLFLFCKKYYETIGSIAFTALFNFIVFLSVGWKRFLNYYLDWIQTVQNHNGGDPSVNTIFYWPSVFLSSFISQGQLKIYFYIIIFIFGLYFLYYYYYKTKKVDFPFCFIFLFALIPSIVRTDTNHFIYSLPLISALFIESRSYSLKKKIMLYSFFMLFGLNFYEVVGAEYNSILVSLGLIGIANTYFLIMIYYNICNELTYIKKDI